MSAPNIYTERQLWQDKSLSLVGHELIVFDLKNPTNEFILYGWDEVGMFTEDMAQPRYKLTPQ